MCEETFTRRDIRIIPVLRQEEEFLRSERKEKDILRSISAQSDVTGDRID